MENNVLSKTIAYLRFPLMVGIVLIHFNISDGYVLHGVTYGEGNPEWYHTIISIFSEVLSRIGVPLFFFFSGFLFFYHTQGNVAAYKRKLKSRARTLLFPYLLWNIIAIAWRGFRLFPCLAKIFPNAGKTGIDWSLSAIAYTFWDNNHHGMFVSPIEDLTEGINNIFPIDGPLWYVRDLIIVIICAPLVYMLIKKAAYFLPIILGLAWYFTDPYDLGYPHQLLAAFFFFSWGAYYSIHRLDFTVLFRKLSYFPILYIVAVVADTITKEQYFNSYIHDIGILLGVVSAIIVTASLLEKGKIRVNSFLAGASFFIFALHTLILQDLGRIIFAPIRSGSPYFLIVFYFFIPALTILICLGLYKVLKKYLPTCASLLTGGR
ncbi:MAG: acyltransferase family protein [Porphyromonadaceae bacterium]|nr:acyltransferase family protein [Porphyromonadaceae bacterium]